MESVLGSEKTTKDCIPLTMEAPPNWTLTTKDDEDEIGRVEKVKEVPPLAVEGVMLADAVDETEKSVANPVVAPRPLDTEMVHEIGLLIRCGLLEVHARDDAAVGRPNATNDWIPLKIANPPTRTDITNAVVAWVGAASKLNRAPPSELDGVCTVTPVAETEKSLATPVVEPEASREEITHDTDDPILRGDAGVQTNEDAVVGELTTTKVGDPLVMTLPLTCTVIPKEAKAIPATAENVKVRPPSIVEGVIEALLEDDIEKSDATPETEPASSDTVIEHVMGLPARWGVEDMQVRAEAVDGIPYTTNDGEPPEIVVLPTRTKMEKALVALTGVVENVKEAPPLTDNGRTEAADADEIV